MNKSRKKCGICTTSSSSRWNGITDTNLQDVLYYFGFFEQQERDSDVLR